MHGAHKIILQKSLIRRLVWLLCFVGSWAMFFVQIQLVFRKYSTFPKNTQVEIVSKHHQFPDLTFCFRRGVSFYDAHEWLMRKHERLMRNETLKSTMADMKLIFSSMFGEVSYIDPSFHSVEFQEYINRSAIPKEESLIHLRFVPNAITPGLESEDLDLQKVIEIPGGKFLKCFTVPVEKYNNRVEKALEVYLLTGTGMIPDMSGEGEYSWKGLSSKERAIVYIHQPGVKINPIHDKQFYDLQPNHEYDFSVNVKQHARLGQPHGQCSSRDPFVQGGKQRPPDVPYRQQDCELSCLVKKMLERDGEVSMTYPLLDGMRCWVDENGTLGKYGSYVIRRCNYSALETDRGNEGKVITAPAYTVWSSRNLTDLDDCPCYPPCNETEYDISVTPSQNPFRFGIPSSLRNWLVKEVFKKTENKTYHFLAEYFDRDPDRALEDLTRVSIQIGKTLHKTIESPLISPTQLISEIGGQLGVWIGISVMTLVEVIELLVDLCGGCRKKELGTSGGTTRQDGDIV